MANKTNVVLVHGLWADGSSWQKVMRLLFDKGFEVVAPQLRLTSIADDIENVRRAVAASSGPCVLAGHSYGGAVITGAGVEPQCAALVYVAAYAPAAGEGLNELNGRMAPAAGGAQIRPDAHGYLWIDRAGFRQAFAADVPEDEARVMAAVQKAPFIAGLGDKLTAAAWETKPAWYQVSEQDQMIPTELERFMAGRMKPKRTLSLPTSHASLVSRPEAIADLIAEAAAATVR